MTAGSHLHVHDSFPCITYPSQTIEIGLVNTGNSCYMASLLEGLASLDSVEQAVRDDLNSFPSPKARVYAQILILLHNSRKPCNFKNNFDRVREYLSAQCLFKILMNFMLGPDLRVGQQQRGLDQVYFEDFLPCIAFKGVGLAFNAGFKLDDVRVWTGIDDGILHSVETLSVEARKTARPGGGLPCLYSLLEGGVWDTFQCQACRFEERIFCQREATSLRSVFDYQEVTLADVLASEHVGITKDPDRICSVCKLRGGLRSVRRMPASVTIVFLERLRQDPKTFREQRSTVRVTDTQVSLLVVGSDTLSVQLAAVCFHCSGPQFLTDEAEKRQNWTGLRGHFIASALNSSSATVYNDDLVTTVQDSTRMLDQHAAQIVMVLYQSVNLGINTSTSASTSSGSGGISSRGSSGCGSSSGSSSSSLFFDACASVFL